MSSIFGLLALSAMEACPPHPNYLVIYNILNYICTPRDTKSPLRDKVNLLTIFANPHTNTFSPIFMNADKSRIIICKTGNRRTTQ